MKKLTQFFIVSSILILSSQPFTFRAHGLLNSTYVVDRLTDNNPTGGGQGTGLTGDLRYTISHAQSGETIGFRVNGTINLGASLPTISRNITIGGPGANKLIVDSAGGNTLAVEKGTTVTISGLAVTGGVGNGGGIFNAGSLTLNNVAIYGNTAGGPTNGGGTGAGIWNNTTGTLTLNSSTISGNKVIGASFYNPSQGGAIANYGSLTINNSTISGNSTLDGSGGGISNTLSTSTLVIKNSTISGNSVTGAVGLGGGIYNQGTLQAENTIIAGNSGSSSPDLKGTLNSLGHNLIGNTSGGSGFQPGKGDLLNMSPKLGALQNNGGLTKTMALLDGSPAVNAGSDATCLSMDQRGVMRPQGSHCDIGAYEGINSSIPLVISSVRADPDITAADSVNFAVTFSGSVTGVTTNDFSLTTTGVSGASILGRSGSGSTYTVSVSTGTGSGTIRLNVVDDDSIRDASNNPLGGAGTGNGNYTNGEAYTISKNSGAPSSTFVDVPPTHPYYSEIELLYANKLTAGCSTDPLKFCPDQIMDRAQAAVFMMRGTYGASFVPNPATNLFQDDWSPGTWALPWAEDMREKGLTAGCSLSPLKYCPWTQLPREQVVIFGLKLKYGNDYAPPPATGTVFADLTDPGYYATSWAEKAYKDGLIGSCGTIAGKPKFCPKELVSRGLGAHVIVSAKNLGMRLYKPALRN